MILLSLLIAHGQVNLGVDKAIYFVGVSVPFL